MKFSAETLLDHSTNALSINLAALIASCAIFVHPDVVTALALHHPGAVWFPGYRRSRPTKAEPRRGAFGGDLLDDNTKANIAIKEAIFALGHQGCSGFATCHIWPGSCYSTACHTALANLVLLPAPLASLTDHNLSIAVLLQSRSYALYGWLPPNTVAPPAPPDMPWHPFIPPSAQVMRRVARRAGLTSPSLTSNIT